MKSNFLPPLWLIIFIVGLPLLCESVYSPSLPDIAVALLTQESKVEFTLTIYLFSFALGSLFFGKISDLYGRKPCMLLGLFIFMIGCFSCYLAQSIEALIISRFIQAFGGSVGSVLGQAICRDAFKGQELGKVYSVVGSAISFFPAIAPLLGGYIAELFGWRHIFTFLNIAAFALFILTFFKLPETHFQKSNVSVLLTLKRMIKDKRLLCYASFVGIFNGIAFSYFAEAPFLLINVFGLSKIHYGLSFALNAASGALGGMFSKYLISKHHQDNIIQIGLKTAFCSTLFLASCVLYLNTKVYLIMAMLSCNIVLVFGSSLICNNALSVALKDYKDCTGTASSLLGCFYYMMISCITLIQGLIHNGSLYPMTFYFLGLTILANLLFLKLRKLP